MVTTSRPEPVFSDLDPTPVWAHFATLCRTPRQSKAEHALRDHLLGWAAGCGLTAAVDAAGNLLLRKAASAGCEEAPGVILQAHLDMVCQKNAGTEHDFARDPIRPTLRDGWLVADETTLGADNGIGVALILAALEDRSLAHGPLEALLTVDEEAGMGGARGVARGWLQGSVLLNLDTEEWGDFYVGCAGGVDVEVQRPGVAQVLPADCECWRIELFGLRGGHSGVDIHEERGNAIKLLVRIVRDLEKRWPLRLAGLAGGSARNALPREASATVVLPAGMADVLAAALASWQSRLREQCSGVDEGLMLRVLPAGANALLAPEEQAIWLASLNAAPHGVWRRSRRVAGVVETSNNLGIALITPENGYCNFMVRSLDDSGSEDLADEIVSLFALSGTAALKSGEYPGWAPDPSSPLLALCQSVYRHEFADEARVQVIHAGLECGLIGAAYPQLQMISFGPTIRGAHAPGEQVEVASVARCWRLLSALLRALGGPSATAAKWST
ncbi:aminoacyl-histidine dipeptidase [Accumulibacter sp.]|uniref:aminoacyl-histidine dipeptidase n=1 Tax=Accumulibacter sp. TaxID=2053492 RepID=UPI0025F9079A|nr:aminoacyl-histidine dipeptidase [Accumulibacter sp.]MCM8595369.1 aminoacyl-histidine dipeptidase [Accumulibacter sp.]MCM8627567.1 aminoacyl-histidine dipeptidase [Accumulibacter sp.]MDS4049516.1 aminoacyl-histidine dipeptidase [Accumulibacter sp.]